MSSKELEEHFDLFYEDIFVELAKYGVIEELHICDNICDHLAGNIYIRYRYEEDAQKAVAALNDRFYAGKPIWAELSPVIDFREGNLPLVLIDIFKKAIVYLPCTLYS